MPILSVLDAFCYFILSTKYGIDSIIILFINEQSKREFDTEKLLFVLNKIRLNVESTPDSRIKTVN